MPYDNDLAERIQLLLADEPDLTTQAMFGGLAFLLSGHLALAASSDGGLLVRVGRGAIDEVLATTTAEQAVMGSRTMKDWVRVRAADVRTERELGRWVERTTAFVRTLPVKPATKRRSRG